METVNSISYVLTMFDYTRQITCDKTTKIFSLNKVLFHISVLFLFFSLIKVLFHISAFSQVTLDLHIRNNDIEV